MAGDGGGIHGGNGDPVPISRACGWLAIEWWRWRDPTVSAETDDPSRGNGTGASGRAPVSVLREPQLPPSGETWERMSSQALCSIREVDVAP
jgi:hypothetical protein